MTGSAHGLTPEPAGGWVKRAACIGRADEMHPDNDDAKIANAKAICKRCTVQHECFWDAVRTGDMQFGIRAGLRANERRDTVKELRRRERRRRAKQAAEQTEAVEPKPEPKKTGRALAKCGTAADYAKHVREKTEKCAPCRRAHADADARLRRTGTTKVLA